MGLNHSNYIPWRFAVVILTIVTLGTPGHALTDADFCKTTEGINQIKAYIACQEDTKISACAGITTQWAGRPQSTEDRKRYHDIISRNKEPLTKSLADKLHSLWRRHRRLENPQARLDELSRQLQQSPDRELKSLHDALKKAIQLASDSSPHSEIPRAVFEPRLKEVNGQVYDIANLPFSQLPAQYQERNMKHAQVILRKYQSTAWITQDNRYMAEIVQSGIRNQLKDELLSGLSHVGSQTAQEMALTEMQTVREIAHELMANWLGIKSFSKFGGGGLGIPVLTLAISQVRDATPISCSTELGAPYITSERPDGVEGCRDIPEIRGNVLRFLDLSANQQLSLLALNNGRVCNFYRRLHQVMFEQPHLTRLQCHNAGFDLTGRWDDGRMLDHKIIYYPENTTKKEPGKKAIKQINLIGGSTWKTPLASTIEVNANGEIPMLRPDSELSKKRIASLRLYLPDAYNCCTNKDPRFRKECSTAYNRGSPPPETAGPQPRTQGPPDSNRPTTTAP